MSKQSRRSVLIDTSFLITLFDDSRANHVVAKQYYQYFIDNQIDMYISAIVASEYEQKASIDEIFETGNFISLPFNYDDGKVAGNFANSLNGDRGNASRDAAKDDVKLLAQASNNELDFVATDDASTLASYCRRLNETGQLTATVITLESFDISHFNGGQTGLAI